MQFIIPDQIAYNSRYSQSMYIDNNDLSEAEPQKYLTQLINLNNLSYGENYIAKDLNIYPYDVTDNTVNFYIDPGMILIDTVFFKIANYTLIDISNSLVDKVKYIIITAHFDKQVDEKIIFKANFLDTDNNIINHTGVVQNFNNSTSVVLSIFKLNMTVDNKILSIYHNYYESTFDTISQKLIDNNIEYTMDRVRYLKIVLDSDIKLEEVTCNQLSLIRSHPLSIFDSIEWDEIFEIFGRWYASSKFIFPQVLPFRNSFQRRLNTIGVFH